VSTLSIRYYNFLKKYTLDFDTIIDNLKTDNSNIRYWSTQFDFINCQLQDLIQYYPKYLNYTSIIDYNTTRYNQNKIYNATSMSYDQIVNYLNKSESYRVLNIIKRFPTKYDDFVKEVSFQDNYVKNYSDIYDKDLFIYNYDSDDYSSNFSYLLSSDSLDLSYYQYSILDKQSFFHMYFLISLMNHILKEKCTLENKLLNSLDDFIFEPSIESIFDNQFETIIGDIVNIILINQYSFNDLKESFRTSILEDSDLIDSVNELKTSFQSYIENNIDTYKYNIVKDYFDIFTHAFNFDYTGKIFNSSSFFNFVGLNSLTYQLYDVSSLNDFENIRLTESEFALSLTDFEQQILQYHQASLNEITSLKNYLYILYLFRDQFEKFINSIDYVISTYVFDNIRLSDIYYFNNFSHMADLFKQWLNYIYYETLSRSLPLEINTTKFNTFADDNTNISKFSLIKSTYSLIEDYIQTDEFKEILLNIQNNLYTYLKASGYVDKNVDWCSCELPLKIYVASLFKDLVHDLEYDSITDYAKLCIDDSSFNYFDDSDDFITFSEEFIDRKAANMFSFYESFVTSSTAGIFSKAVHDIYRI
jgi:hypothetical protein